jgi:hypothetical protein
MVRYGHPLAATQFQRAHALGIRLVPLSVQEILARLPKVLTSYWGEFGHGVQFPFVVDTVMMVIVVITVAGLVVALVRHQLPGVLAVPVVAAAVTFAAFIVWMRNQTGTENARLLSPAFLTISALGAAGLLAWFPNRFRAASALALTALSVVGGTAGLFLSLVPGYAMPVYLTDAQTEMLPAQGVAQFDNGVELVAAAVEPRRVKPGQELAVSVYWRATQPITDVYRVVVEVRDEQDHSLGRMSTLPLAGRYATTQMQVNRVFHDEYRVEISGAMRALAHVYVGWYQQRPPNGISHVRGSGAASAQVGQIKVRGAQPPELIPPAPFSTTLGGIARLEGYQVIGDEITLYWRSLAAPAQNYTVFVHALDANGKITSQADAPIGYPISLWDVGEQIVDVHRVNGLASATTVRVGLYDPSTGQRLTAQRVDGTPWPDNAVDLPVAGSRR